MPTKTFSIEQLDAIDDDAFYDLANGSSAGGLLLDHDRDELARDYDRFLATIGDDAMLEVMKEDLETKDAFTLYAEMRINGFDRGTAPAPGI